MEELLITFLVSVLAGVASTANIKHFLSQFI